MKTSHSTLTVIALLAGLTTTACTAPPPKVDREALFLQLVHENTANKSTDAELITAAKAACRVLADGGTLADLGAVVVRTTPKSEQADVNKILGYGISQYCPEYGK